MGKTNLKDSQRQKVFALLVGGILIAIVPYGCAHQKPQPNATHYRFSFNDETYRIRSISSEDKTEAYNELVGGSFVAVDFDQDRIVDQIMLGVVSLTGC